MRKINKFHKRNTDRKFTNMYMKKNNKEKKSRKDLNIENFVLPTKQFLPLCHFTILIPLQSWPPSLNSPR